MNASETYTAITERAQHRWVTIAALLTLAIGGFWLIAWLVGVVPAWSFRTITVKTNMALSQVLSALALVALAASKHRNWRWWVGVALAAVVLLVGSLTLSQYLFGWNLGIDQLIASEPSGALGVISPNRMGMPGATSLLLLGIALLSLALHRKSVAAYAAMLVCMIDLVPAVGYLYGVVQFYGQPGLTGIAWSAVVALLSLAVGVILACADSDPVAKLFRADPGGALLRKMLPAVTLIPLVLGFLRMLGQYKGLYDTATGAGVLVMSLILVFFVVLWRSASGLSQSSEVERQAREALKRGEEQRRIALDAAELGTWDYNLENGQLYWDARFREIWGLSSDEMPLMDVINNLIHPDDSPRVDAAVNRALDPSSGGGYYMEYRILRPDGSQRWIAASGRGFFASHGGAPRPVRFIGTVEDITERKKSEEALRESEQRLRATFDNAALGIVEVDEQDNLIAVNDCLCQILGYSREELLRMNVHDLTAPEDQGRSDQMNTQLHDGLIDAFDYEKRYVKRNGSPIWVHVTVSVIRDSQGHFQRAIGTVEDISERKQAEEALRRAEARWSTAVESFAEGAIIATEDEQLIYWNPAARDLYGFRSPEEGIEALDKSFETFELWDSDGGHLLELDEWPMRRIKRGETVRDLELRLRRPDQGWEKIVSYSGAMVDTPNGERLIFLSVHDLTEQRLAEENLRTSEEKFRAVFEQAAVGMGRVGFYDAKWIDVNDAFCRMLGYSAEEFKATPWPEITHPDDVDADLIPFQRMAAGEIDSYSVEKRFMHKAGHYVWARLTLSLARDAQGRPDYEIAIVEDMGDQKRFETELRQLNAELEQRVAQRTAELKEANEELEAFSYSVSHDLRAPLRAIDGFSGTLIKRYRDSLDPQAQEYLDRVRVSAQRMAQLIDDILGLSRAGRAEIHRQPVDVSTMAMEVAGGLRESQPDRNVDFVIEPGITANADSHLLRIIFDNLLGNAWKFTSKRDTGRIEVGSCEQAYYVKDNGAGFNPERADRLFAPFQRLHTESDFPGTGIGLALVQRIVRRHGGRIWAEGEVGKGATFYFTLGEVN